jgi:hypothetical protein
MRGGNKCAQVGGQGATFSLSYSFPAFNSVQDVIWREQNSKLYELLMTPSSVPKQ